LATPHLKVFQPEAESPKTLDLAEQLYNHLDGAILRAIRRQNTLAIATSGGLDSSVLAALIASHADIPLYLVTASKPGAIDATRARMLARHLELPLIEAVLTKATTGKLLEDLAPLLEPETIDPARAAEWGLPEDTKRVSPIRAGVGLVLLACAKEASRFARRLVLGQGADELFGGYARYQEAAPEDLAAILQRDRDAVRVEGVAHEARIANACSMQFHYPYLDPRVVSFAANLPMTALFNDTERKPLLREVARKLDLPRDIAEAPKTAAQYGSGSGEILADLAQEAGMAQNDFLTALVAQRKTGEPHSLRT
jgi:asparagine synthase (glutamine-hydrolysing)